MTPSTPPIRIPFDKVESLVTSGNSGLTANEILMFVDKGVLHPDSAHAALNILASSSLTKDTMRQTSLTRLNKCVPPGSPTPHHAPSMALGPSSPWAHQHLGTQSKTDHAGSSRTQVRSFRSSSEQLVSSSSHHGRVSTLDDTARRMPVEATRKTTWYSSFSLNPSKATTSSSNVEEGISHPETTLDSTHAPELSATLSDRPSCSTLWQGNPSDFSSSSPEEHPIDEQSYSDHDSFDTESGPPSEFSYDGDVGSSSSWETGRDGRPHYHFSNSLDLNLRPRKRVPRYDDAFGQVYQGMDTPLSTSSQKRNKRKSRSSAQRALDAPELHDLSPGIRLTMPFGTFSNRRKLPTIAELNEEDTFTATALEESSRDVMKARLCSPEKPCDSGIGSEACSPRSHLLARAIDSGILSTYVSKAIDGYCLGQPPSLASQRLQIARQYFAGSGVVQVVPPSGLPLVVPGGGVNVLEYPLLLPEIQHASKERVWMKEDWESGQQVNHIKNHSNKRVRVRNDSMHATASSEYSADADYPYMSRRSSRLSSGPLRNGENDDYPLVGSFLDAHPVDGVSMGTLAKQGNGHKFSLDFILNGYELVNKEGSLISEDEIGLDNGAGSGTGPQAATARQGQGTKSDVKPSQKMLPRRNSIVMSSTKSIAKRVVEKQVSTRATKSVSSPRMAGTLKEGSAPESRADPFMVYFKIKPNGGWYVRTQDNLMDPPPEDDGGGGRGSNAHNDGKNKKVPLVTDGVKDSVSSSSSQATTSSSKLYGEVISSVVHGQSAITSASPGSTLLSHRVKAQHNNNKNNNNNNNNQKASKVDTPSAVSASTSSASPILAHGKKQTAKPNTDRSQVYVTTTTTSITTTVTSVSRSPNDGSKLKVISDEIDLPISTSIPSTSVPFSLMKAPDRNKKLVLTSGFSVGPTLPIRHDRPHTEAEQDAAEALGTLATQASSSSSAPPTRVTYITTTRANAFSPGSPGSLYRQAVPKRSDEATVSANVETTDRACGSCDHMETRLWRYGFNATSLLCNACGLGFRKSMAHCANVEKCAYIPTVAELGRMQRERTFMKWESVRCLSCRGPVLFYRRDQDN
ncbi:hypothetical protein EMPS_03754 [Entomortierella parvispora]|uniref:GATA-type domain-containing protein n=1 Tax=Entomortierella parvispora TaxID=205924 RepID=A0A9P3H7C3_9FUNG|nr:hypothetical protein EMPS_03754 [Entomortierella parvispora]